MEKKDRKLRSEKINWREKCPLGIEIPIENGHNPSSYYWFRAAKMELYKDFYGYNDTCIDYLGEEISIEEDYVGCFLMYFLHEHFINEIIYNRLRVDHAWGNGVNIYYDGFSQHETVNFYTYETMEWMLEDIADTIELLRNDYDNEKLIPIKKQFHYGCMIDYHQMDDMNLYSQDKEELIVREHVEVIIDFYQRFVEIMWNMMDENPEGNVITVEGP